LEGIDRGSAAHATTGAASPFLPRGVWMLRCEECGRTAETEAEALGWQAYVTVEKDDEPPEVAVYCRECAEREFGGES
jgi:hypothetical protein